MPIGETPLEKQLQEVLKINHKTMWLRAANVESVKRLVKVLNQNQLRQSKDSLNNPLFSVYNNSGVYSIATASLNPSKQAGAPYTLNDTGEFYKSIVVSVFIDGIRIEADPTKSNTNLYEEYGKNIIGLTDENIETVSELIILHYRRETRKVFNI
tara:strand:- start:49 stop:513 length:465 start_codon:yes stop_codon:yes gene_type:complete